MSRMTGMTWVTRAISILNLSEMTGQPIPIIMRILVLIKTNRPDQSKAKHYTQRKSFFSKNPLENAYCILKMSGSALV